MFHRRPSALGQLSSGNSHSLARLSALDGLARSMLVGIIPLTALEALGSKAAVSQLYFIGAVLTLCITLNVGTLERWLNRRGVVSLAGAFLIIAAMLLCLPNSTLFSVGIGMRSAAASMFSVCISLYIMDFIAKREFTRNESLLMQYAGASWLVGPALGLWLWNNNHPYMPFAISALAAILLLSYFWRLRLGDNQVVTAATSSTANPWKSVVRYFRQPRLRIAYSITLSRSCFWVTLFVFGPIYVVEANLPIWMAGALLSVVSGLLFFSPVARRLADKFGTRRLIAGSLLLTATSLIVIAFIGEPKPIGLVFWVLGAIGGAVLDVLGNIPFMRSVRPRERTAMTTVFSTWREGSELLTPALVTLVLIVAPMRYFYLLLALMHLASAYGATHLPRRL